MKTHYQYIHFVEITRPHNAVAKTSLWSCRNTKSDFTLGEVNWYGPWRQYCFFPYGESVFNAGCLADIQHFLGQLNAEQKKKLTA